jgi:hypothetical protein
MLKIEARFSTAAIAMGSEPGTVTGLAETNVVVARRKREAKRWANIVSCRWVEVEQVYQAVGSGLGSKLH